MFMTEGLGVLSMTLCAARNGHDCFRGSTRPRTEADAGSPLLLGKFARCALAGASAERHLTGSWDERALEARSRDIGRAKTYLVLGGGRWKTDALDFMIRTISDSVLEEIVQPLAWRNITTLACRLLVRKRMKGKEVTELLRAEGVEV